MKWVKHPFMLHFCSFRGKIEEFLFRKGCETWKVHVIKEDVFDCGKFKLKDIVYLTPNADDVIEDIYPDKVYVIVGGI